jgi:hypothetical protein
VKISTILDHIDSGHIALPEFQRGYVWNREQVRGLFDSLYRRHPVGSLLVWATESNSASHRGDGQLAAGVVKLLLDGQQRMTTLYGVVRGRAPKFFDGNAQAFSDLRFHLDSEKFAFYSPISMKEDPLWVDVTALMQKGMGGLGHSISVLNATPAHAMKLPEYLGRLTTLLGILDIGFHVEEVTGADKTLDIVVDIFNKVNSGGTKLSKGDLALAKICADWPKARETMKAGLAKWEDAGYSFNLDWLLRSVNTVMTGEAKFQYLHEKTKSEVEDALKRAVKQIDASLNMIAGRFGLDHDQVFFGRFAVPVMVRYLDQKGTLTSKERDKLLFWYLQAAMWGRYSGSTETFIDQDLAALEGPGAGVDKLIEQLRLWRGGLRVEPEHFTGWSVGARFYSILYMLTRMGAACDWGNGLPLKAGLLGKMNRLEVHHIFPKSRLYASKLNFKRPEVNALGNFCFLTKDTNLDISNRLPKDYFPEIEKAHPGALASQWIPADPTLWEIDRYRDFLQARKELLAKELNLRLKELLHGDLQWLQGTASVEVTVAAEGDGITSEAEENALEAFNDWVAGQQLPRGQLNYELSESLGDGSKPLLDLAWPAGLQENLSQPVALLLNRPSEVLAIASQCGFQCFAQMDQAKAYIQRTILAGHADQQAAASYA